MKMLKLKYLVWSNRLRFNFMHYLKKRHIETQRKIQRIRGF